MTEIPPGMHFQVNNRVEAKNRQTHLVFQADGNLVLYRQNGTPVWATGTNPNGRRAVFQTDGNLVVYGDGDVALWASNTHGNHNAILAVQSDGNLVIYTGGNAIWASHTCDVSLRDFPDVHIAPQPVVYAQPGVVYAQPGVVYAQPGVVYGQPAYGQPAYGQPAYGQPAYGQPAYGQPAYGQPAYGQPAYGQPAYGQPAYGQPAYGQQVYVPPQPQLLFGQPGYQPPQPSAPPAAAAAGAPEKEKKPRFKEEEFKEEDVIEVTPQRPKKDPVQLKEEEVAAMVAHQQKELLRKDSERIYKACKGFGTNDTELIGAVCSRNKAHLRLLADEYSSLYQKSLVETVTDECSGDYKRFLVGCITPTVNNKVKQLEKAAEGLGTNETVFIEIAVGSTAQELVDLKNAWDAKGKKPFIDFLKSSLSGDFEKLIVKLMTTPRPETSDVNEDLASKQAEELKKAAKGFGVDEDKFISILGGASNSQIQAIKRQYESKNGKSLQTLIEGEFTGDLEKTLVSLLFPTREDFLAQRLYKAMEGLGTNEDPIIRILAANDKDVCRKIAEAYLRQTNVRLVDAIKTEMAENVGHSIISWISLDDPYGTSKSLNKSNHELTESLPVAIAERDAQLIRDACKGFGTNETALIDVICGRSKSHLFDVDLAYRERFGITLNKLLESECSGDFKKILRYIVMTEDRFDCYIIKKACSGLGTNESLLVELFATRGPKRLAAAKAKFDSTGKSLTDLIASETSGNFKDVLLTLLNGRSEEGANEDLANQQADQIYQAGVGRLGTDEGKIIEVLAKSSVAQCAAISRAYEKKYGSSLEKSIRDELSGDLKYALLGLILDPIDYYCSILNVALSDWNTDESTVSRVIGGNDKPTVRLIADRYFQKYDIRLVDQLNKELSGDFRAACLSWLERPPFP